MSIPDPVVLLDARAKYVHPAITVERASTRSIWLPNSGERATVPINAIGWDVDPATGETLGALIERERTNRFTKSNQLDHEDWTQIGDLDVTADGSWWRIEAATAGAQSRALQQNGGVITEDYHYAMSFDIRFGNIGGVLARFADGFGTETPLRIWVSESEVTPIAGDTDPSSMVSSDIVPLRNGAYRVSVCVRASANASSSNVQIVLKDSIGTGTSSNLSIGEGLWLRAMQFEEIDSANGDSPIASSYIETDSASATRAADSLALLDIVDQPWFDPLGGTLLAEVLMPNHGVNGLSPIAKLGNSPSVSTGIVLRCFNGVTSFVSNVTEGGSLSFSGLALSPAVNRVAASFNISTGDADMATNGGHTSGGVLTSFTASDLQDLYIGRGGVLASQRERRRLQGWLKHLVYYPAPLTPADLQSLTAIQE